jgi:hypothetical protein
MCSINWAGWLQAIAAFIIVYFTGRSLMVLKGYAEDTKTIATASVHQADISVQQIENAQKPFVALILKPEGITAYFPGGWVIENQGFGPALNLRYSHPLDPSVFDYNPSVLDKGQYHYMPRFVIDQMRSHEFKVEYQSLSGTKYRTLVVWVDGEMRTTFSGPL